MLLLFAGSGLSAQNVERNSFALSNESMDNPVLQEKVIISINKSFFLTGEDVLCSVFIRDAWLHKPLSISNIITIELLDRNNRPISREKYSLKNGKGSAIISIPGSLESGIYTIRAYTNWMRNSSPSLFFYRNITIIDPEQVSKTDPIEARKPLKISFFSEGGNFVNEVENHLIVKATDSFDHPVTGFGYLVSESGDTIGKIKLNADGLGDVFFTAQKGQHYNLDFQDKLWELPKSMDDAWVLKAALSDNSGLEIDIQKNVSGQGSVSLLLSKRGMLLHTTSLPVFDCHYRLNIPLSDIIGGVGKLLLVDENGKILAKRLIQFPENKLCDVEIAVEEQEFNQREEVELLLTTLHPHSDVSVVVQMEDEALISEISSSDILNYYSDAAYCLPLLDESKDLQLIIIGEKQENWKNEKENSGIEFMPEIRGQMVSGRLVNGDTSSFKGLELILAKISNEAEISNVNVTNEGRFFLHPKDFNANQEYVLVQKTENTHSLLFDDDYSNQFVEFIRPTFSMDESLREHIEERMVYHQLQQLYDKEPEYFFRSETKFYGAADEIIEFSDYIKLPVMEEFFRELTKYIILTREDGKLVINVLDKYRNRIIGQNPIFLLDGIPVFDAELILNIDPEAVKRISTKASRYLYGELIMDGIIDIETHKADFSAVEFPENASMHNFHPIMSVPDDYNQNYCKTQDLDFSPDLRTTLCWEPILETDEKGEAKLSFFTSDLPGNYIIKVTAFSKDGSIKEITKTIVVK